MCLVNNYIHRLAAKFIFCVCDILFGMILWEIIEAQMKVPKKVMNYVGIWILCPLVVNLSTRGSNDNMVGLILFIAIYYLLKRRYVLAGIFYGLSIHFKIYPIIYSIVFFMQIDTNKLLLAQNRKFMAFFKFFITKDRLVFAFTTVFTFVFLIIFFYLIYGYDFLF